jgi:hypothetical protein
LNYDREKRIEVKSKWQEHIKEKDREIINTRYKDGSKGGSD